MRQIYFHICYGLPGSGKTTLAKNKEMLNNRENCHVECDKFLLNKRKSFDEQLREDLLSKITYNRYTHYYIDGLFTNNIDLKNLCDIFDQYNKYDITVIVEYFTPDVEACIWNDKYRRSEDSRITIIRTNVEMPDLEKLAESYKFKFKLEKHRVKKSEKWQVFARKIGFPEGEIRSSEWCLGGTSGNCWNSELSIVSGDEPLSEFEEFDKLLEKEFANITYFQYKNLRSSISVKTYDERDYYGGSVGYSYYSCDIKELYDRLVDIGLIDDEYFS